VLLAGHGGRGHGEEHPALLAGLWLAWPAQAGATMPGSRRRG